MALRNRRWVHLLDWFRCQATVKVKDQEATGVRSEAGIRSQLVVSGVFCWSLCTHGEGQPVLRAVLGCWSEIKFSPWPWTWANLSNL